jgi:hypothetical protein
MRGLMAAALGSAASVGCAFAAVGLALYGGTPEAAAAAMLYGGFGVVTGGVCSLLDLAWHRLPAAARGEGRGAHVRLVTTESSFLPSRFGA